MSGGVEGLHPSGWLSARPHLHQFLLSGASEIVQIPSNETLPVAGEERVPVFGVKRQLQAWMSVHQDVSGGNHVKIWTD